MADVTEEVTIHVEKALLDEVHRLKMALNKIALWSTGPIGGDEPRSANQARAALGGVPYKVSEPTNVIDSLLFYESEFHYWEPLSFREYVAELLAMAKKETKG